MTNIFLSYARGDDEPFVMRLYKDLNDAGFNIWFDRVSMPSRQLTFLQEIRDAIAARQRLLLVIGPQAVTSDYVTQEWQFAYFAANKCVNPIVRLDGVAGDGRKVDGYGLIPEDLKLLHAEDFRDDGAYDVHLKNLVRQLSEELPPVGKLVAVPELPPSYRAQPERLKVLKDLLLLDLQKPVVVTGAAARVGLQGMGGIGKSVMANALAHHPEVQRAFGDGIFWITLGQEPDVIALQRRLAKELGDDGQFHDVPTGTERLRDRLKEQAALLILDNVWQRVHAEAFNVVEARGRILLTTRDAGLVTALAAKENHYQVQLPTIDEAKAILASFVHQDPETLPPEAWEIIAACGRLPLVLALCGGMVQGGISWSDLLEAFKDHDLEYLSTDHPPEEQHQNAWKAMDVSIRVLPEEQRARFAELVVFGKDAAVTEEAVVTLWEHTSAMPPRHGRKLLADFVQRSLVQRLTVETAEVGSTRVNLHDLLYTFAEGMADKLLGSHTTLHQTLLDAYWKKCPDGWATGPDDGYFIDHLAHHLEKAGQKRELHSLLWGDDKSLNPWFNTCEALGQRARYLADVERAWKLADKDLSQASDDTSLTDSLTLQFRYALTRSTLTSLSASLSPELLVQCVANLVITVQQAIERSRQFSNCITRERVIRGLTLLKDLSTNEHNLITAEAIELVSRNEGASAKSLACTLLNLAPALPVKYIRRAVSVCRDIYAKSPDPWLDEDAADFARCEFARELSILVPYLPKDERTELVKESLALAIAYPRWGDINTTLRNLAEHADATDHERIEKELEHDTRFGAIRSTEQTTSLTLLTSRSNAQGEQRSNLSTASLRTELINKLDAAQRIGDTQEVLLAILTMLRYLPETERDIFASTMIEQLDPTQSNTQALLDVLPHIGFAARLHLMTRLLERAHNLRGKEKVQLLIGLLPFLNKRGEVVQEILDCIQECLGGVKESNIEPKQSLAQTIGDLAPYATHQQIRFALSQLAEVKGEEWYREIALEKFAERLKLRELRVALALAYPEGSASSSVHHVDCDLGELFGIIAKSLDEIVREILLIALATKHPQAVWTVARTVDKAETRAKLIVALWEELPEVLQEKALGMVLALKDDYIKCSSIKDIALHMTEAQAITVLETLPPIGQSSRTAIKILASLVPILSETKRPEVLRTVCDALPQFQNEWTTTQEIIERLSPYFTGEQLLLATAAAQRLPYISPSVRCLCALLPFLPKDTQMELSQKAFALADELKRESERQNIFQQLAPVLVETNLRRKALKEICTEGWGTSELVTRLISGKSESCFEEATEVALTSKKSRALVLETLVNTAIDRLDPSIPSDLQQMKTIWTHILHDIANQSRTGFLQDFDKVLPIAVKLGGPLVLRSFCECVQKVQQWWP